MVMISCFEKVLLPTLLWSTALLSTGLSGLKMYYCMRCYDMKRDASYWTYMHEGTDGGMYYDMVCTYTGGIMIVWALDRH